MSNFAFLMVEINMLVYKNIEISKEFAVSNTTVMRWVEAAIAGKNNLQIIRSNAGRSQILKNEFNKSEILRLKIEGSKFKTTLASKKTEVEAYFYQVFDADEQFEIYSDLLYKKEINLKFWYKNGGALQWDEFYYKNFSKYDKVNEELLLDSVDNILNNLQRRNTNLIDIGGGNAHPVKNLLNSLSNNQSYIGIDISNEMLEIAINNVKKWKPELNLSKHNLDVEHDNLGLSLLEEKSKEDSSNLILYIGNTICNQQNYIDVLKNIRAGMLPEDVFVFSVALFNDQNATDLDYAKTDDSYGWIPNTLGFDIENCQTVYRWDAKLQAKIKESVLDKDYELTFNILGKPQILKFSKGEKIRCWYHRLFTLKEILEACDQANLNIKTLKKSEDDLVCLVICKPKF